MVSHLNVFSARQKQRGSVLLVSILLLLLASVIGVLALNVGAFEQRASGNDVRGKMAQQLADSALAQGIEEITGNTGLLSNGLTTAGGNWELCGATDTSFPCGAVPAARRATMFRYVRSSPGDVDGDGANNTSLDTRMLPITRHVVRVNNSASGNDGFPTNYGAGAVLCRLVPAVLGTAATCSTDWNQAIKVNAITVVGVAGLTNEGARATATKTVTAYSTFGLNANQPPIMATGMVDVKGTLDVVTSPNGGYRTGSLDAEGSGLPVSIWTRKALDGGGTPDTCYADEFFSSGSPTWYPSSTDPNRILRCDDCECDSGQLTKVQGNTCTGGSDILVSPASSCSAANLAVQANEFPCDLFEHIFGIAARTDNDSDFFCETRINDPDPVLGGTATAGRDELYLAERANWIVSPTTAGTFGARFASDSRLVNCATALTKTGLIWIRDTTCNITGTVGSPGNPVLLVIDSEAKVNANTVVFGLIFVRDPSSAALSATTGGAGNISANGGAAIYGGIVVQGQADKLNGTGAIIYDGTVMANLVNQLSNPTTIGLPGSWNDQVRY